MHSRFRTRPFLISFLCTALALLFLVGILVVDAEGRRLSFNDTSPALELVYNADGTADMQVNAFRLDRQFDVTGRHRRLFLHPARAISRGGECVCVCRMKTQGDRARLFCAGLPYSIRTHHSNTTVHSLM